MSSSGTRTGGERTYGISGFVAVFVVVCLVGVVLLVFGGGSSSGTQVVPTPQTLPEQLMAADGGTAGDAPGDPGVDDEASGPGSDAAEVGAGAGGSVDDAPVAEDEALPPGVAQVMRDEGITAYLFEVPRGVDAEDAAPAVAPTRVRVGDDGRSATVTVGCAASSDEFLAQIAISPGDTAVTFTAVALVPATATAPCDPAAGPRTVEIVLDEPVGDRAVVVVPAGTDVPELSAG